MPKAEFDKYALNYKETMRIILGILKINDYFFDSLKVDYIKKLVTDNEQAYTILDFGCGIGKMTGFLAKEFRESSIYGYDISSNSLDVARREYTGLENVFFIDHLSKKRFYDFIIVSNVFHHIKPVDRLNIMLEIKSILKPNGKIIVIEHNPYNPLTQYVVNNCAMDVDAKLISCHKFSQLANACHLEVEQKRYIVFFPWTSLIYRKLEFLFRNIPLGAQYMLLLSSI